MSFINIVLLLQVGIEEKIKKAPDKEYEIGVAIGAYLPLVVLGNGAKILKKRSFKQLFKRSFF